MASGQPVVTIAVPCVLSSQRRAQTLGFYWLLRKLQEAMTTSPRFEIQIPSSPMSASPKYGAVLFLEQQIRQSANIILKP